jgi:hypothetical protein
MPENIAPVAASGLTRGAVFARAALGAGTLTAGGLLLAGLPDRSISKPSASQDEKILQFVLAFERLQADFYAQAHRQAGLTGELRDYATIVGGQEKEHVALIESALGSKAAAAPTLDFGDAVRSPEAFARTAQELEDLGVAAYNGQAPNLTTATLRAAAKIVSVEARHAGWIRDITGDRPAPRAADAPITAAEAQAAVDKTGFVK